MSYEVGSVYRATFTVVDSTGALVDPATKIITVTLPDQTTAAPAVVRDSLGTFHADYTLAQEGLHRITVTTTSPTTTKTDYVNAAAMWRSIIGIDEAKSYINDLSADRDPILRAIMAAATEEAESIVGSCLPRKYTNQRIVGTVRPVLKLPYAPLLNETAVDSIASVYAGGPSWTTTDLIVYPDSGTVECANFIPFYFGPWKATYTVGRMVIPEMVQLAVKEIIYDMWSTQRPYGADELEPGPDDTARFEQMLATYQIPPHAKALLSAHEMPGFA